LLVSFGVVRFSYLQVCADSIHQLRIADFDRMMHKSYAGRRSALDIFDEAATRAFQARFAHRGVTQARVHFVHEFDFMRVVEQRLRNPPSHTSIMDASQDGDADAGVVDVTGGGSGPQSKRVTPAKPIVVVPQAHDRMDAMMDAIRYMMQTRQRAHFIDRVSRTSRVRRTRDVIMTRAAR
jgi:hypothetical protein